LITYLSVFHLTAAGHEEIERLERLIVRDLKETEVRTHKERMLQNHRVRKRLDVMQSQAAMLVRTVAPT
jgi:splicing factor 3A subunit 3